MDSEKTITRTIIISLIFLVVIGFAQMEYNGELGGGKSPSASDKAQAALEGGLKVVGTGATSMAEYVNHEDRYYVPVPDSLGEMIIDILPIGAVKMFLAALSSLASLTIKLYTAATDTGVGAYLGSEIASMLGQFGNSAFTTWFFLIIPITYGLWACYQGFMKRKYVLVVLAFISLVLIYSVGVTIMGEDKSKMTVDGIVGLSSKGSMAATAYTVQGLNYGEPGCSSSASGVSENIIIADALWATYTYVPWASTQFGEGGLKCKGLAYADGKLSLEIKMKPKETELISGKTIADLSASNWTEVFLGKSSLTNKKKDEIDEVIYGAECEDTDDGSCRERPSPWGQVFPLFMTVTISFINMLIMWLVMLLMIGFDILAGLAIGLALFAFIIVMIPGEFSNRIYKAYLKLIVSVIVLKVLLGIWLGLNISLSSWAYIKIGSLMGWGAISLVFGSLLSLLISILFIVLLVGTIKIALYVVPYAGQIGGSMKSVKEQFMQNGFKGGFKQLGEEFSSHSDEFKNKTGRRTAELNKEREYLSSELANLDKSDPRRAQLESRILEINKEYEDTENKSTSRKNRSGTSKGRTAAVDLKNSFNLQEFQTALIDRKGDPVRTNSFLKAEGSRWSTEFSTAKHSGERQNALNMMKAVSDKSLSMYNSEVAEINKDLTSGKITVAEARTRLSKSETDLRDKMKDILGNSNDIDEKFTKNLNEGSESIENVVNQRHSIVINKVSREVGVVMSTYRKSAKTAVDKSTSSTELARIEASYRTESDDVKSESPVNGAKIDDIFRAAQKELL